MKVSSVHAHEFDRQLLIRLRESPIDWDIVVDESRRDVDGAVERPKTAVRPRDHVAAHLAAAIDRIEAVA
jgi:hypothetical protein